MHVLVTPNFGTIGGGTVEEPFLFRKPNQQKKTKITWQIIWDQDPIMFMLDPDPSLGTHDACMSLVMQAVGSYMYLDPIPPIKYNCIN